MSHSSGCVPAFYSYSLTEMDGLNSQGNMGEEVPEHKPLGSFHPNQFMNMQVRTESGHPLTPTLFSTEVVDGIIAMQAMGKGPQAESPMRVLLLSNVEAVVEFSPGVNLERTTAFLSPLQYWLGQKIQLECRAATPEEVDRARRQVEEEERTSQPDHQEAKFLRMMEHIHKLAVNPGGEALRIQTFSGSVPPNKNETTFAHWIHEV